jgi:hypothetical protein
MLEKVRDAFGTTRALSGTIDARILGERGPTTPLWFVADSAGDLRLEVGRRVVETYDARTGTARLVDRLPIPSAELVVGNPVTGPPELTGVLQNQLGAAVRSLLAAHDPGVAETEYAGRRVWAVTLRIEPAPQAKDLDRIDVLVDEQTGIPLKGLWTYRGQFRQSFVIREPRVNPAVPRAAFVEPFPASVTPRREDNGYRRVSLARVARVVGYDPLVPGFAPAGYTRAEVAVARRPLVMQGIGSLPTDVVQLSYRRGLQQFVVQTQTREYAGQPHDPVGHPATAGVEDVALRGGALDGRVAHVVVDPRVPPHLWVATSQLVVSVAGDLTRDELVAIAQSFR